MNNFKKDKWKYIWTNNGRTYLKEGDGDKHTFTFDYTDKFADLKSKLSPGQVKSSPFFCIVGAIQKD